MTAWQLWNQSGIDHVKLVPANVLCVPCTTTGCLWLSHRSIGQPGFLKELVALEKFGPPDRLSRTSNLGSYPMGPLVGCRILTKFVFLAEKASLRGHLCSTCLSDPVICTEPGGLLRRCVAVSAWLSLQSEGGRSHAEREKGKITPMVCPPSSTLLHVVSNAVCQKLQRCECAFVEGMFLVQTRAEHYIVSSCALEHGGKEYILQHQEN